MLKQRYVTNAVKTNVPVWLQNLIWCMWDIMEAPKRNCLQVFTLSGSNMGQQVEHLQAQPPYCQTVETAIQEAPVFGTVLVVEEDDCLTMLFVDQLK